MKYFQLLNGNVSLTRGIHVHSYLIEPNDDLSYVQVQTRCLCCPAPTGNPAPVRPAQAVLVGDALTDAYVAFVCRHCADDAQDEIDKLVIAALHLRLAEELGIVVLGEKIPFLSVGGQA
jgi:hypothetical protein